MKIYNPLTILAGPTYKQPFSLVISVAVLGVFLLASILVAAVVVSPLFLLSIPLAALARVVFYMTKGK
jgi:hypothetical protein